MNCNPFPCATWSDWGDIECSIRCGPGDGSQHRLCMKDNGTTPTLPKHCRGSEDDAHRETGPCQGIICPGWQKWINLTECTKLCDVGLLDHSRECMNNEGAIEDHLLHPDLCPGPAEEFNVPCNSHDCPPPQECHPSFPFELNDQKSCCRYDTRTDSCDGTPLLVTDPVECCREGELYECPTADQGGICITRLDSDSFCQRDPTLTQYFGSTAFVTDTSNSYDFWAAKETCSDSFDAYPLTLNEAGMTAAFVAMAGSGTFSTTLKQPLIQPLCTDGGCTGILFWGRAELPFTFDSSEQTSVQFNNNLADRALCGLFQSPSTNLVDEACVVASSMACQADCKIGTCPRDHPFVIENGKSCCNSNYRTLNLTISCDGGPLMESDTTDCCLDYINCSSTYGCINSYLSDGNYCIQGDSLSLTLFTCPCWLCYVFFTF